MNRLSAFFQNDGTNAFGLFYPTNHIVALFPTMAQAVAVRDELKRHAADTVAVTGEELIEFAHDQAEKAGLWGAMNRELSRIIATEEQSLDRDVAVAEGGAACVAVFCPDGKAKERAWELMKAGRPIGARFYGTGGIEHMVGDEEPEAEVARGMASIQN